MDLAESFERVITYDYAAGFVEMAQRYAPANVTASRDTDQQRVLAAVCGRRHRGHR